MADFLLGISQLLTQKLQPPASAASLVPPVQVAMIPADLSAQIEPTIDLRMSSLESPRFIQADAGAVRPLSESSTVAQLQRLLLTASGAPSTALLKTLTAGQAFPETGSTAALSPEIAGRLPETALSAIADKPAHGSPAAALAKPSLAPATVAPVLSYTSTPQVLTLARQKLTSPVGLRPSSGSQLYRQRQLALQAGRLYTRLAGDSFAQQWLQADQQPTHEQWVTLLKQEAEAIAQGQGDNRLTVVVGDSLSLWLPPDLLPTDGFWLNQGISGDTTQGILKRLSAFAQSRPDTVHVMAGVNDLKNGVSDPEILANLTQIMSQLHQQHPQARIVVHSILPTRWASIPCDRIRQLNQQIAQITRQQGVTYLDLQPSFTDEQGTLRSELTVDGVHLTRLGYQVWQIALLAI